MVKGDLITTRPTLPAYLTCTSTSTTAHCTALHCTLHMSNGPTGRPHLSAQRQPPLPTTPERCCRSIIHFRRCPVANTRTAAPTPAPAPALPSRALLWPFVVDPDPLAHITTGRCNPTTFALADWGHRHARRKPAWPPRLYTRLLVKNHSHQRSGCF